MRTVRPSRGGFGRCARLVCPILLRSRSDGVMRRSQAIYRVGKSSSAVIGGDEHVENIIVRCLRYSAWPPRELAALFAPAGIGPRAAGIMTVRRHTPSRQSAFPPSPRAPALPLSSGNPIIESQLDRLDTCKLHIVIGVGCFPAPANAWEFHSRAQLWQQEMMTKQHHRSSAARSIRPLRCLRQKRC